MKPFLKWAGGKYRIIDKIISALPKKKTLIEPFVGRHWKKPLAFSGLIGERNG